MITIFTFDQICDSRWYDADESRPGGRCAAWQRRVSIVGFRMEFDVRQANGNREGELKPLCAESHRLGSLPERSYLIFRTGEAALRGGSQRSSVGPGRFLVPVPLSCVSAGRDVPKGDQTQ